MIVLRNLHKEKCPVLSFESLESEAITVRVGDSWWELRLIVHSALMLMKVEYKTPNQKQYLPRTREPRHYRITTNRPWTDEYKRQTQQLRKPVVVQPVREWSFFRGDRVEVLVGRDKGKQGIVSQVSSANVCDGFIVELPLRILSQLLQLSRWWSIRIHYYGFIMMSGE